MEPADDEGCTPALDLWGIGDNEGDLLSGPPLPSGKSAFCVDVDPAPTDKEAAAQVFRGMLAKAGGALLVGGEDPFAASPHPLLEQLLAWTRRYCVLDLQRACKPYLQKSNSILPCPCAGFWGTLKSKGARYDRIRQVHNVGTVDFVLPFAYRCTTCGTATSSTAAELHEALRAMHGLAFVLDMFPYTFSPRGGISTELLWQLTTLATQARTPFTVGSTARAASRGLSAGGG